jgi:sulfite reductase (ferredoxin)
VPDGNGEMVEGFQLHLGGHLGTESRLGRKSRGLKVTADGVVDYVENLLRAYTAARADGESFADWVARADESELVAPAGDRPGAAAVIGGAS